MKTISKLVPKLALLASSVLLSSNIAMAENASDRFVYVGADFGIAEPIIKKFKHKESDTQLKLKQSKMYTGRVGYSFYPNMMVELSYTHQPKYKVAYLLPKKDISAQVGQAAFVGETPDETNFTNDVFTLNLLYQFDKQFAGIRPYVIVGAGMSRIVIKANSTTTNDFVKYGGAPNTEYFRVNKNKINCFTWQIGGGLTKEITDNLSIDLGVKMQVINDIKIKYEILVEPRTQTFQSQEPIKKTIAVGEFTLGFTFKLPV